jgi:hypothetical protein
MSRAVRDILRLGGQRMSTRDLAIVYMSDRGMDVDDGRMVRHLSKRTGCCLRGKRDQQLVMSDPAPRSPLGACPRNAKFRNQFQHVNKLRRRTHYVDANVEKIDYLDRLLVLTAVKERAMSSAIARARWARGNPGDARLSWIATTAARLRDDGSVEHELVTFGTLLKTAGAEICCWWCSPLRWQCLSLEEFGRQLLPTREGHRGRSARGRASSI